MSKNAKTNGFQKATITFHGQFPIDMLRYDRCYPYSEGDSGIINRSIMISAIAGVILPKEPQVVQVQKWAFRGMPIWTTERWESFGCRVQPEER